MYSANWQDSTDMYLNVELVYVKDVTGAIIKNQNITITQNGTYTADEEYTGFGKVTVNTPEIKNQDLVITKSGEYQADSNHSGLGKVTVDILEVNNQNITITKNGHYEPKETYTGFGFVDVATVEVKNQNISIKKNGKYQATEGFTGFGTVVVNIPKENNGGLSMDFAETPQLINAGTSGGGSACGNSIIPPAYNSDFTLKFSTCKLPKNFTAIV